MDLSATLRRTAPAWPALCLLLLAAMLGVLPPVPIDETRYLGIAWEMRQSASWATLHLNGFPYFDKPPLLFWLINLSWSAMGVSLWSARLLVLAFGAGSIELCRRLEQRLSPGATNQAAWLLLGTLFFALLASVVMFDIMLCFFVLMAFLAVVRHVQGDGLRALVMLFVACSLGMLTKGPVMLLHMAGPILLARWWAAPGSRPRIGMLLSVALLSVIPVLLWALIALRGYSPHEAWQLIMKQTTGRVVDSFVHNRPFWWYLPVLPVLMLPWPLLLRWKHLRSAARRCLRSTTARFGLCAWVPAFIGFSLVSGKQVHYLLPLLPGAMLLLSALWQTGQSLLSLRRMLVLVAAVAGALIWALLRPAHSQPGHDLTPIALYLLSAACIILAAWLSWTRREVPPPRAAAIATLLLAVALLPLLRSQVIGSMDVRPLAQRVASLQRQGVPLVRIASEPGLLTFAARMTEPLVQTDAPAQWAQQHPDGFVLTYAGHGHMPGGLQDGVALSSGWVGLMPAAVVEDRAAADDHNPAVSQESKP